MLRRTWSLAALALAALALGIAGCGGDDEEEAAGGGGGESVTVDLGEQSGSGQSGTATLTPTGDGQTMVSLELSNPPDVPQPVHIHSGTCEELGDVVFPLTNLEGGTSETTVDVSLEELQSGEFAVNAHASEEDIQTYVACGNIT